MTAAAREVPRPTVDAMPKLTSEREDPEFSRRVFESMIDDEDSRLAIASLFAKLIQDAQAIHPGCWKATVRPKDWRLVVGPVRIAKLSRRRLALLTVSDLEQLVPEAKALLDDVASVHPKPSPRGVEGGVYRILHPEHGQHRMNAVYTAVRPIATASARRVRQVPNPRTHSPGAIEYLSKLLGLQLPQPVYTGRDDGVGEVDGDDDDFIGDDDDFIGDDDTPPEPPEPPPYTIDDALGRVFLSREELTRLLGLLAYKRNLVLQGPPGVGKTFVAADLAYVLLGAKDEDRIKRVQFHQSYAYEDFVRGYRPREGGGFEHRDGPMLEFCERARRDDRPHVMIIDEINRGNLSKILGELMLLIEPDKRDPRWAVELAYARPSEPPFWVPPNLFVIGTMNTADRSLALVDYALRRRFAFAWVLPAFGPSFRAFLEARGAAADLVDRIFARLAKLNAVIEQDTRNLGRGYVIGHSYFCQADPAGAYGADWYERIVRFEIEPLLEEYFAEDPDKVPDLVGALLS